MATKKRSTTTTTRAKTTRAKAKTTNRPPDAISLLVKDHETVRGLLSKLENAAGSRREKAQELVDKIDQELKIHTQIEEEIFYPAFRDAVRSKGDKKLYFEAKEEHHVVKLVMPEVTDNDNESNEEFAAKAKVLKELVEHHADEEEKEMFPRAKKAFDKDELRELGERLLARKTELMGQ
jgi:hemerythrin-like domain-containing protein